MSDCRKLDVWTKAHELALEVHRASVRCDAPAAADCAAEVWRTARGIPARIMGGCDADAAGEFAAAMRDAASAVDDLAYRLLFARDAGLLDAVSYAKLEARTQRVRGMLGALIKTVMLRMRDDRRLTRQGRAARPLSAGRDVLEEPIRLAVARAMRSVRGDGSSPRESRRK